MIEAVIVNNLLAIAKAYARATNKSLTTVSKDFYGRGDFFSNLKEGERTVSVGRLSEMLEKFRADWPDGADWPPVRTVFMTRTPPGK